MAEWFETKVKFLRQLDNGLIKQITEQYLVDSMSFTEAEGRVMTEVGEGMREVTVVSIKRSNIKETVMYGDTDMFFKVKVSYELMDEETEKSKKVNTYLLVNANDAKEAYERTCEHLKEMLVPFTITQISESPIIEVYQYQAGLRPGLRKVAQDFKNSMQKIADDTGSTISISGDGENFKEIAAPKEKEIDCAYTKKQQAGRSYDDEKPQHESPFDRGGFPKVPTPPDMSPNGLDGIKKPPFGESPKPDPTDGQAVDFEIDPLWKFMADLGVTLLESQQHEVYSMHESCGMVEFVEWLQDEHDMDIEGATKVFQFLEGESKEGV